MNNVSEISSILGYIGNFIGLFWWILFPISFYYIFKILWIEFVSVYSSNSWHKNQKWAYLEIIPPRDIEKGPKLMEDIFTGITSVISGYNVFDEYLKGAFWHDRFSFELVGAEGKMHFYIRTQKKYRNLVEAQIYARYPEAEILEVPDYTQSFPLVIPNKNWDLWGADFQFVGKDPIPIKTYDKFEENVTGEMNDPMAAIAEVMGTLGPGQHIWLQYVLQPLPEPGNKKNYADVITKLKGEKVVEKMTFFGHLLDILSNIIKGLYGPMEFAKTEKAELPPLEFRLSPIEKEILKATEENMGKNFFKTKMRLIYLGRRENFDKAYVAAFNGTLKQFNDINFNQFKPEDISKTYGQILFADSRAAFRKRKIYGRYRNRNMDGNNLIFSTKELATLYHFPDMGVKSPSIRRVESKLGSAPSNLPISE